MWSNNCDPNYHVIDVCTVSYYYFFIDLFILRAGKGTPKSFDIRTQPIAAKLRKAMFVSKVVCLYTISERN